MTPPYQTTPALPDTDNLEAYAPRKPAHELSFKRGCDLEPSSPEAYSLPYSQQR